MKLILNFLAVCFIFIGCSSKQYFEPKDEVYDYEVSNVKDMNSTILTVNKDGATLENYQALNKDGISTNILPNGYTFLNKINTTLIASNKNYELLLKSKKDEIFNLKKNVISASLKSNLLALLFDDNSIALYDTKTKKFKFKSYHKASLINDIKIANPIFLTDIVLFPTLDGNVIIVNLKEFKTLKTIKVDPNNKINNIIFLKTIGDTMIAATPNKILTLGDGSFISKDYIIRDIISTDKYLYIATLDGKIIKLDLGLKEINITKLKFAKIHTLIFASKLYALESQEYLIEFNNDL